MSRQETGICAQLVVDPSKLARVEKMSPNISLHILEATVQRDFLQNWGIYWKKGKGSHD